MCFKLFLYFTHFLVISSNILIGQVNSQEPGLAADARYIGCYIDGGPGKRLMNGLQQNFPNTLTPNVCNNICFEKGFPYAGTQNRIECFCSRSKPPDDRKSDDSQCDSKCDGDITRYCGGFNRLSVHNTGISEDSIINVADLKYIGCFREHANGTRLMVGYYQNYKGTLTNQLCSKLCRKNGFRYAGTEYGLECFCDNTVKYQNYVSDEECNSKCEGNNTEVCGGVWRISLYHTGIPGSSTEDIETGKYIGCFKDKEHPRQLNNYVKHFGDELTLLRCTGLCFSLGFLYAGTQSGNECYCGDEHPDYELKVKDSECSKPCSGEPGRMCGSVFRNSIRETGIQDIPEQKYLGCFFNLNNNILSGLKRAFKKTNSPRRCFNICRHLGFKYAGVEFSEECFCGNEAPAPMLAVSKSDCNMICSANPAETCGAGDRQQVYHIDIQSSDFATANYVGCYIDGGPGKRLMKNLQRNFLEALSPELCSAFCFEKGFLYAGIQNRIECFCSKTKPLDDRKTEDSHCNVKCAGNGSKYCGGNNMTSVFRTGLKEDSSDAELRYIGCFKEFTSGPRLLSGYRHELPSSMTSETCIKLCRLRGFSTAGTQAGRECFCDNKIASYQNYADEEDCNMACSGNNLQKCGGIWRLSIYHTGATVNTDAGNYIGCFKDQENPRNLNQHIKHFGDGLTLLKCTGLCYSMGFLYAGTQNSDECYCGDEHPSSNLKVNEKECSKPCSGEPNKMCGGHFRNSIHETGITDISEKDSYLGCYNDYGHTILKGLNKAYIKTNTPRRCFNICLHLGYKYSGVQNGDGCLCGNDPPQLSLAVSEGDCNKACSGNAQEMCGGAWRMRVFSVHLKSLATSHVNAKYIGCFREHANGTRTMSYRNDFPNTLTHEICIRHCQLRGYQYAGMEFGHECYCDNKKPSYHDYAVEESCDVKCEGNTLQRCGGGNRITVFNTGISDSPIVLHDGKYIGCYKDQENARYLDGYMKLFENGLTPFNCTGICHSMGFLYSGTQNSKECYCGDKFPNSDSKVSDSECSKPCSGEPSKMCGDVLRNSIRETGIKDDPAQDKYLGCYNDLDNRILSSMKRPYKKTNSPRRCLNICRQLGFRYSGVEFGEECFCGNYAPASTLAVKETECNMPCSGSPSEKCGAALRVNVYSTFTQSPDIVDSKYIGCLRDYANGTQLMTGSHEIFQGTLTNKMCLSVCLERGFVYAGTEYGRDCFCDNRTIVESYQNYANEEDCNMLCEGNNLQFCGGHWRISLFRTGISGLPAENNPVNYLGCYKNEGISRLSGFSKYFRRELTVMKCTGLCYSMGFLYSGTTNSTECFCVDDPPSPNFKVAEAKCSIPCLDDPNKVCGSESRSSVRETGIPDVPVTKEKYIGCFNHYENHFLEGMKKNLQKTNSPRRCFNICWDLGFKYSGVEAGEECYCGNEAPPPNIREGNEQCNQLCPGDPLETCGGNWRMAVYLVDLGTLVNHQHGPLPVPSSITCQHSETTVSGRKTCKGDIIFAQEFSTPLESKWKHVVMIPEVPDNDFVVFHSDPKNSYVSKDNLVIKPSLLSDELVLNGSLELKRCTGSMGTRECGFQAFSYNILPPVASARMNTRGSFNFRYGIVEIRAKLPIGDWLVPELWLEPKDHVPGSNYYNTGRIRLAMIRGNQQLQCGNILGSNRLESGIMLGQGNDVRSRAIHRSVSENWLGSFHTFKLIWKPDSISFKIDNETEEELISHGKILCDTLGFTSKQCAMWGSGSKIAPFNSDFYISLGVSAGNSRDFPDNCLNRGKFKPWKNFELKALLKFWQDKPNWFSTWSDDKSALYVDYVRVTAL